jgi:hypothetical protein
MADYEDILLQTADLVHLDREAIWTTDWKALRGFHGRRLQDIWRRFWWPTLTRVEQRFFRNDWSAATTYAAGTEVYYAPEGTYYQALQASTNEAPADTAGTVNTAYWVACQRSWSTEDYLGTTIYALAAQVSYGGKNYQMHTVSGVAGTLPTDTTHWAELLDFNPYIALDQTWQAQEIGDVLECWNLNPQVTTRAERLTWFLSNNGIQVESSATYAWVDFRIPCPRLKGDVWDADETYSVGDQVYSEPNFYDCIVATAAGQSPITTPTSWSIVSLPDDFEQYLICGAAADWERSRANAELANFHEGMANTERNDLQSRYTAFQGQLRRTIVLTR